MLRKIDIKDWEKTTDSTNYINSKDEGKTHFCDTMEAFRKQLIQYVEKNGLNIHYKNNILSYSFWTMPPFDDKELSEFEYKLKTIFVKSIKSANTINEIYSKKLSLEEELARSKQTIFDAKEAVPNIDKFVEQYLSENLDKNQK